MTRREPIELFVGVTNCFAGSEPAAPDCCWTGLQDLARFVSDSQVSSSYTIAFSIVYFY